MSSPVFADIPGTSDGEVVRLRESRCGVSRGEEAEKALDFPVSVLFLPLAATLAVASPPVFRRLMIAFYFPWKASFMLRFLARVVE